MYGAAVALLKLQQPDKARSQLKNITSVTWNLQVCHFTVNLLPLRVYSVSVSCLDLRLICLPALTVTVATTCQIV